MCNKRKWVAMLLVLLMLTLALAACQPNPVEPDGSGTGPEETVPPTEETTEPDSTESTSGAETETEMSRFDYFSADMNDYVTIDPSMYTDITVALDAELLVDDEDVAQYIIELRFGKRGEAETDTMVDEPLEWGDDAYIYYTGYIDGVAFDGGSNASATKPTKLGLGSSDFMDGFEAGLVGVIPSQTSKENPALVTCRFPSNYGSAELAGKEAVFEVYVVYALEYPLPDYDVAFLTDKLMYEFKEDSYADDAARLAEFEFYVKEYLVESGKTKVEEATFDALWKYLLATVECKQYPAEEIDYYRNSQLSEIEYYYDYYTYYGYNVGTFDEFARAMLKLPKDADWQAEVTESATNKVKCDMIRYAVAQQQNMKTITDAELDKELQYWVDFYKSNYGMECTKQELLEDLGESALWRSAMVQKMHDYLLDRTTVTYRAA